MNASLPATRHQTFSVSRVMAIASNSLLELVRLKVFYFLLFFAMGTILVSFFASNLKIQDQFQILKDVSLGGMSMFSWLLAVLATAMLLPKDIEDRTLYTILAKPVSRFEYLLGKFLGVVLLIFIALSLMSALFVAMLYAREQIALENAQRMMPSELLQAELQSLRAGAFNANLLPGIVLIFIKAVICAALTLLISCFATSSIFTIIVSFLVYVAGHIQSVARAAVLEEGNAGQMVNAFLWLVAVIIPDLNSFSLIDDIVIGNPISWALFAKTAAMGGVYVSVYFLVSYLIFWGKEL
jgi:ABC-type transport system involved in multi-copper enzyme maturation permease subunit